LVCTLVIFESKGAAKPASSKPFQPYNGFVIHSATQRSQVGDEARLREMIPECG
jgi:hypothetical protein